MERYFIIGIDTAKDATGNTVTRYRVTKTEVNANNSESSWKFANYSVSEMDIIKLISKGASVMNACVTVDGKLSGAPAAFSRFEVGKPDTAVPSKFDPTGLQPRHPFILVAEIVSSSDVRMGYKVIDYSGKWYNLRLSEIKAWIETCEAYKCKNGSPMSPFQNVMVRGKDSDGNPIIAAYPHQSIAQSVVVVNVDKAKSISKPKTVITDEAIEKKVSSQKSADKYSEDCKKVIIQARDAGLNIRPLLNPAFTKGQLSALISAMHKGVNVTAFADPKIPEDYMHFCTRVERFGYNSSFVARKQLNPAQRVQIIVGLVNGVDVAKYADKNIPATEMEQIRIRMANKFWGENSLITDNANNTIVSFKERFD